SQPSREHRQLAGSGGRHSATHPDDRCAPWSHSGRPDRRRPSLAYDRRRMVWCGPAVLSFRVCTSAFSYQSPELDRVFQLRYALRALVEVHSDLPNLGSLRRARELEYVTEVHSD